MFSFIQNVFVFWVKICLGPEIINIMPTNLFLVSVSFGFFYLKSKCILISLCSVKIHEFVAL